jgi:hypothetical protein
MIEKSAVSARENSGLDNDKLRAPVYEAIRATGILEVSDFPVMLILRVQRIMNPADQGFIGTCAAESHTVAKENPLFHT